MRPRNVPHGWAEFEAVKIKERSDIPRFRYFGLHETKNGAIAHFICCEEINIPSNVLEIQAGIFHINEINNLISRMKERASVNLKPGCVAAFTDHEGVHTCVVLEVYSDEAKIIFCTSSPAWNPQARQATSEELALLGMPIKCRTYFAPVVRPHNLLSRLGHTFPIDRIRNMLIEFNWQLAIKY